MPEAEPNPRGLERVPVGAGVLDPVRPRYRVPMRRKVLVAVAFLPVWVILGELVLRGYYAARGEAYSAAETREVLERTVSSIRDPIPGLEERPRRGDFVERIHGIHPYFGWESHTKSNLIESGARSYREGLYDDSFEILVVGGSVSGLVGRKGANAIQRVIGEDPRFRGRKITILNHGRGSFKQPQQLMLVAYLLSLGYEPDAVVNIDGFNEVALGVDNVRMGAHHAHPHWPRWGHVASGRESDEARLDLLTEIVDLQDEIEATAERALSRGYSYSVVLGRRAMARVAALRVRWRELQGELVASLSTSKDDPARGPVKEKRPKGAVDDIVDVWVSASISLDAICRERGIVYLHALQPTLHDAGSKPLTPEEQKTGGLPKAWRAGVQAGYPRLRAAGPRLVGAGVAFLDGTDTFAELEAPTYYDGCHFRGVGMELFARSIGQALLDAMPN